MSFRTPSTTQQRQTLLDLERTKERLALNTTRLASGKRITRPGDDPAAAALVLDFQNSIQANGQFIKQADSALSFLMSSEDVVTGSLNAVTRLRELAQQAANSTNGASGRAALAQEVDSIRSNLLALANTKDQGKYLFAGTQTQTLPFAIPVPPNTPPYGPGNGAITYSGDSGDINLDVTSNTAVTTNLPGDKVFFGSGGVGSSTDLFTVVTQLHDALLANSTTGIQTAMTDLKGIFDNLNQIQDDLGGRQAGLLDLKDTLSGFNLTLQGLQDTQEGTDYVQSATELSSDQTIQTATLSALAKINKTNLFDYLG